MIKAVRVLLIFLTIILSLFCWGGSIEEIAFRESGFFPAVAKVFRLKSKKVKNKERIRRIRFFTLAGKVFEIKDGLKFFIRARWYQTSFFEGVLLKL